MSDESAGTALCIGIFYPFALTKWYITEHIYFWEGAKELLWAIFPIANAFYGWDQVIIFWAWLSQLYS
jgi:hypothetical protein